MKIALAALVLLPALPFLPSVQQGSVAPLDDRGLVERAITDYVLGFYDARPDLIERGVSKDLKKMGFWRDTEEAGKTSKLRVW